MSRVKKVLDNHGLSGDNFNAAKPVIFAQDHGKAAYNASKILSRASRYDLDEDLSNFLNAVIISKELDEDGRYND
tara:strand:+ start:18105 stop:18329 length:225 start_codon:yes stop_codon:yes gene_type:complete